MRTPAALALLLSLLLLAIFGLVFWRSQQADLARELAEAAVERQIEAQADLEEATFKPIELETSHDESSSETPEVVEVDKPQQDLGRIRGHVWIEDKDTPCPAAQVGALRVGEHKYAKRTETDDQGAFELADLAPGNYIVWAWKSELAAKSRTDFRKQIEVKPSATVEDIERILVPGVDIVGLVIDKDTREPIEGARVWVSSDAHHAVTNEDGRFALLGERPGSPSIRAAARGYAFRYLEISAQLGERPDVTLELTSGGVVEGTVFRWDGDKPAEGARVSVSGVWSSDTTDSEGRYEISGVPLDSSEIKLSASLKGLRRTEASAPPFAEGETTMEFDLRLEKGFALAGVVVDSDDEPIDEAKIAVDWGSPKDLVTDAEGEFRVEGAHENCRRLTARKKGFAPTTIGLEGLAKEQREEIRVVLEPGHTLAGVVVNERDEPIENAWLYVELPERTAGGYPSTRSDAEGKFSFEDLPAKIQEVGATKRGYTDNRNIRTDVDRDDLRIVLLEAAQISGVARDKASGDPVSPITVKLGYNWSNSTGRRHQGGISTSLLETGVQFGKEDGSFSLRSDLQNGVEYDITVSSEGYSDTTVKDIAAWPLSEDRAPLQVLLEKGQSLEGRVIASSDATPLPNVHVFYVRPNRQNENETMFRYWQEHQRRSAAAVIKETRTDEEGNFVLIGVTSDPALLLFERSGYARKVVRNVVPTAGAADYRLDAESAIEGSYLDANGKPVSSVSVGTSSGQTQYPYTSISADGKFRIESLPPGEYQIRFSSREMFGTTHTVVLGAGETQQLDVVASTGSIVGKVTESGRPLASTGVSVQANGGFGGSAWTETDGKGNYRVRGVPPGDYTVRAMRRSAGGGYNSGNSSTVKVTVGNGESRRDIALSSGTLKGIVIERGSRAPVTGAQLALYRFDPDRQAPGSFSSNFQTHWHWESHRQLPHQQNNFEFQGLKPGRYVVSATLNPGADQRSGFGGPFELDEDEALEGLEVIVGGAAGIRIQAQDADGEPAKSVMAQIRLRNGLPFSKAKITDGDGVVTLDDIPPGDYALVLSSSNHAVHSEDLTISDGTAQLEVTLGKPSYLVLDLGSADPAKVPYTVMAIALSGDPGWPYTDGVTHRPLQQTRIGTKNAAELTSKLVIRPGTYRIRVRAFAANMRWNGDPTFEKEVEVTVPEGGEATVGF